MKTVMFTKKTEQPFHKLWKNFLTHPPAGFTYVDCEGKPLRFPPEDSRKRESRIMHSLFVAKGYSSHLCYYYKMLEEKAFSKRMDRSDADLLYCMNGRLHRGEKPWVVDYENSSVFFSFNLRATLRYAPRLKRVFQRETCKAILPFSETGKESFLSLFGADIEHKVHVAPNVVPLPENTKKLKHEGFTILFTGSANIADYFYLRGGREVIRTYLALADKYPDMKLVMRCAVPEREKRLLAGRNVEIYEGLLPGAEFEDLFRRSDLYLLPGYKGDALSVIGAMSYCLPIVTSDLLELGEPIENGVNGFKIKPPEISYPAPRLPLYYFNYHVDHYLPQFDPQYVERIVEKVEALYHDKALATRMGRNNLRKVKERHSITSKNKVLKEVFSAAT